MALLVDLTLDPLRARHLGAEQVTLTPGATLLTEGEVDDDVFVLATGTLEVVRDFGGEGVVIATVDEPGSLIGELSALNGSRRTATVRAADATEVLRFARDDFDALLIQHPDLAEMIAAEGVRRAEQGELAQLFAEHFDVTDREIIALATSVARWERLAANEILFRQGDAPGFAAFVLRGRLAVSRSDQGADERLIGEVTQGEVVGEIGLLDDEPRNATVTAARDTVLAILDRDGFLELVTAHPPLLIRIGQGILRRSRRRSRLPRSSLVVAVVAGRQFDVRVLASRLQSQLAAIGSTELLGRHRIDALLDQSGIADSAPGGLGDIRVTKLLHDLELTSDYVLLEVGRTPGNWSRRALALADRVMIVVPPAPDTTDLAEIQRIVHSARDETRRIVVVAHPPGTTRPTGTGELLDALGSSESVHVHDGSTTDMGRLARIVTGTATGLVLGGGGARGFAHLGVYRALHELGVTVDAFGGSSIGSPLAAGMADGLHPDDADEMVESGFSNVLDYTIPLVSLVKGERIARAAEEVFGDRRVEDLWNRYFCVSTNLTTSRAHVYRRGAIVEAIRASVAIPGVMPPVPSDEQLLVDGGLLNNLPVDSMREITPHGDVIAVDVSPLAGPAAKSDYGLSVSGWQALRSTVGRKRAYPRMASVLLRALIAGSQQHRDSLIEAGLIDCYLDLDLRGVSMLEFDAVRPVARRGYELAMPRLEAWLESKRGGSDVAPDGP